ncbi:MAG: polysaccharide deacetylase family protein [Candidatus Delongbacteria bacterium]|nr:polysaccharide deacetylase family protein [Candidatus Delongbacteria bacterium]
MTHLQKIYNTALLRPFYSTQGLVKNLKYPLVSPFYHTVSDILLPHISSLYKVKSTPQFISDLDFLLQHFEPVSIDQVVNHELKPDKPYMMLSFDDGLKECYSVIAPILKSKGIPAAFFINPAFIDDAEWFFRYEVSWLIHELKTLPPADSSSCSVIKMHEQESMRLQDTLKNTTWETRDNIDVVLKKLNLSREYIRRQTRIYLTKKELIKLHQDDFHIGVHSMHHPLFSDINNEEQIKEVKDSFDALHNIIQPKCNSFAFPFTDDGVSSKQLKNLYNEATADITFGTSGIGKDVELPHYQRIPMEHNKIFSAEKIVKSELLAYKMKKLVNKA